MTTVCSIQATPALLCQTLVMTLIALVMTHWVMGTLRGLALTRAWCDHAQWPVQCGDTRHQLSPKYIETFKMNGLDENVCSNNHVIGHNVHPSYPNSYVTRLCTLCVMYAKPAVPHPGHPSPLPPHDPKLAQRCNPAVHQAAVLICTGPGRHLCRTKQAL